MADRCNVPRFYTEYGGERSSPPPPNRRHIHPESWGVATQPDPNAADNNGASSKTPFVTTMSKTNAALPYAAGRGQTQAHEDATTTLKDTGFSPAPTMLNNGAINSLHDVRAPSMFRPPRAFGKESQRWQRRSLGCITYAVG